MQKETVAAHYPLSVHSERNLEKDSLRANNNKKNYKKNIKE